MSSASSLCACGRALPTPAHGRRSCSPACKRGRDQIIRKVERRRAWIALWLVSQDDPDQVAAAVADLEEDIRELLATVTTGGVDEGASEPTPLPPELSGAGASTPARRDGDEAAAVRVNDDEKLRREREGRTRTKNLAHAPQAPSPGAISDTRTNDRALDTTQEPLHRGHGPGSIAQEDANQQLGRRERRTT